MFIEIIAFIHYGMEEQDLLLYYHNKYSLSFLRQFH